MQFGVIVLKNTPTFAAISRHFNYDPAIRRNRFQLTPGGVAAVEVDHFIKVAVGHAQIDGIEQPIALHDIGKQVQGVGVDLPGLHQLGVAGQDTGQVKGVGIDGVEVVAGTFSVTLVLGNSGFDGHGAAEVVLQADGNQGSEGGGDSEYAHNRQAN